MTRAELNEQVAGIDAQIAELRLEEERRAAEKAVQAAQAELVTLETRAGR